MKMDVTTIFVTKDDGEAKRLEEKVGLLNNHIDRRIGDAWRVSEEDGCVVVYSRGLRGPSFGSKGKDGMTRDIVITYTGSFEMAVTIADETQKEKFYYRALAEDYFEANLLCPTDEFKLDRLVLLKRHFTP